MNHRLFSAPITLLDEGHTRKFQIAEDNRLLTHKEVIDNWINDESFRKFFCALILDTGLPWYVWEMPAITRPHLDTPFECVLVTIPPRPRRPDQITFANYFDVTKSIVTFENLGKDALLVVPSPYSADDDYSELALFLKYAPEKQKHELWKTLGICILERINSRPMWVSVAGGGVAWLHVRLDSFPKYYRHTPYRTHY